MPALCSCVQLWKLTHGGSFYNDTPQTLSPPNFSCSCGGHAPMYADRFTSQAHKDSALQIQSSLQSRGALPVRGPGKLRSAGELRFPGGNLQPVRDMDINKGS